MNATEAGEIEYTLAAHHYENDGHDESQNQGRRNSCLTACSSTTESECAASFLASASTSWTGSLSRGNEEDEVRVDVERLIPIAADEFHHELNSTATIDSNYHFVVTGRTWDILCRFHPRSTLDRILVKGTVYARMSPQWKSQLIELLQVEKQAFRIIENLVLLYSSNTQF